MIANDQELEAAFKRITKLYEQVVHLRRLETIAASYDASVSGFIAEIERTHLEVREYFSLHPTELAETT